MDESERAKVAETTFQFNFLTLDKLDRFVTMAEATQPYETRQLTEMGKWRDGKYCLPVKQRFNTLFAGEGAKGVVSWRVCH